VEYHNHHRLPIFYLPTGDSTKSLEDQERRRRRNNRMNRMKKTRWRKWWSVGGISSVCNVDLLNSRRLKLHRQCLVNRVYAKVWWQGVVATWGDVCQNPRCHHTSRTGSEMWFQRRCVVFLWWWQADHEALFWVFVATTTIRRKPRKKHSFVRRYVSLSVRE
jgi:hypothetical protein